MEKLVRGVHQFQSQVFRPHREFFARLADGQTPEALFITCADSRVNPNLITQTGPGDLFILRNAGNLIPPYGPQASAEAATIEFAVAGLNVQDIIVCGHTHCGAVTALLEPERTAKLPSLARWLANAETTRSIITSNYGHLSGDNLLVAAIEENVLCQLDNLRTHPSVAAKVAGGTLHLHGWVYEIDTGRVFAYQPEAAEFIPISEAPPRGEATKRLKRTSI
jgi:carbonic anhydrase